MLSCLFTIILTTPSTMQHFLECTDLFQDSSSSHSIQIVQEKERERWDDATKSIQIQSNSNIATVWPKTAKWQIKCLRAKIQGRKKGVLETKFCSMKPSVFISVCLPSELCCLQLSHFTYDTINCATTNLFSLPRKFLRGEEKREKVALGAINFYGSLAFALKLEQSIGIV